MLGLCMTLNKLIMEILFPDGRYYGTSGILLLRLSRFCFVFSASLNSIFTSVKILTKSVLLFNFVLDTRYARDPKSFGLRIMRSTAWGSKEFKLLSLREAAYRQVRKYCLTLPSYVFSICIGFIMYWLYNRKSFDGTFDAV